MKRAIGIAATLFLTACFRIPNPESTGTAPDYGGTGGVGTVSSGGVNGTGPVITGDPTTYEGIGPATGSDYVASGGITGGQTQGTATPPGPGLLGDEWDSGWQQCNLSNLKILYRFQKVNSSTGDNWSVYYSVGAEDKRALGSDWKYGYGITSVYYFFSYGPNTIPITGTLPLSHVAHQEGFLVSGSGQGGFTEVHIRVSRSGGAHGMHMDWPGSGCALG